MPGPAIEILSLKYASNPTAGNLKRPTYVDLVARIHVTCPFPPNVAQLIRRLATKQTLVTSGSHWRVLGLQLRLVLAPTALDFLKLLAGLLLAEVAPCAFLFCWPRDLLCL